MINITAHQYKIYSIMREEEAWESKMLKQMKYERSVENSAEAEAAFRMEVLVR